MLQNVHFGRRGSRVFDTLPHSTKTFFHALAPQADARLVASQGFAKEVERLATPMGQGLKARANFSFTEQDRPYLDIRGLGTNRHK